MMTALARYHRMTDFIRYTDSLDLKTARHIAGLLYYGNKADKQFVAEQVQEYAKNYPVMTTVDVRE